MRTGARIIGTASLIQKFKAHPDLLNRTAESVLKQEGRGLCKEYGRITVPYGYQDGVATGLRKRVREDVSRVFAVRSSPAQIFAMMKIHAPLLANAYWHAHKANRPRAMADLVRKANLPQGLNPALHKGARTGKKGRVGALPAPLSLVSEPQLRTFTRRQLALVGFAKAGWLAAAKAIGGRVRRNLVAKDGSRSTEETFPKWVRDVERKHPGIGGARFTNADGHLVLEIFTSVKHAVEALPPVEYEKANNQAKHNLAEQFSNAIAALNKRIFRAA